MCVNLNAQVKRTRNTCVVQQITKQYACFRVEKTLNTHVGIEIRVKKTQYMLL